MKKGWYCSIQKRHSWIKGKYTYIIHEGKIYPKKGYIQIKEKCTLIKGKYTSKKGKYTSIRYISKKGKYSSKGCLYLSCTPDGKAIRWLFLRSNHSRLGNSLRNSLSRNSKIFQLMEFMEKLSIEKHWNILDLGTHGETVYLETVEYSSLGNS